MQKLLIVSAQNTGHGHMSISEALCEKLSAYPDIETRVVDGFDWTGSIGRCAARSYGPVTRLFGGAIWRIIYALTNRHPRPFSRLMGKMMSNRLYDTLSEYRPDAILSVHGMFCGGLLDALEKKKITIPVAVMLADIIDLSGMWFDRRMALTLCPTSEAYEASLKMGISPAKLQVTGFPVRAAFCIPAGIHENRMPLHLLLMSGAEGSGRLLDTASEILLHTDAHLTVICGRNQKLKSRMDMLANQYEKRLAVCGFVSDVADRMRAADAVLLRAGPNSLMEAAALRVPTILLGALPGQEAHNPLLAQAHGLAVCCKKPSDLPKLLNELAAEEGKLLTAMRNAQKNYPDVDTQGRTAAALSVFLCSQCAPKGKEHADS